MNNKNENDSFTKLNLSLYFVANDTKTSAVAVAVAARAILFILLFVSSFPLSLTHSIYFLILNFSSGNWILCGKSFSCAIIKIDLKTPLTFASMHAVDTIKALL